MTQYEISSSLDGRFLIVSRVAEDKTITIKRPLIRNKSITLQIENMKRFLRRIK